MFSTANGSESNRKLGIMNYELGIACVEQRWGGLWREPALYFVGMFPEEWEEYDGEEGDGCCTRIFRRSME